jgi:hypothetical protein
MGDVDEGMERRWGGAEPAGVRGSEAELVESEDDDEMDIDLALPRAAMGIEIGLDCFKSFVWFLSFEAIER